jgi:hypothetical protein
MPLGILDASIVNAQTGAAVEAATAYVDGFFDPVTGECAASDHCAVSAVNGTVTFDAFPPGPQRVIIVKEGFEQVALPVEIAPGDAQQVQVNMAPAGLLNGNIVLLLDWATGVDLDLVVSIPVGGAGGDQCVFGTGSKNAFPGNLTDVPYAQLEREANGKGAANRLETVRIALNEDKTGPYYDGAYSIVVNSYNASVIDEAAPVVRVVRASESGAAAIELFTLPTDAVEDPTGWHVFDLHGDGTLTAGGTTEAREASADPSDLSECTTSSIEYNNQ